MIDRFPRGLNVSFVTSSENFPAPEASDSKAKLALFAAAAPKAATSFSPELNATIAIFSVALMTSSGLGSLAL